jgi:hypothetical protein
MSDMLPGLADTAVAAHHHAFTKGTTPGMGNHVDI